MDVMKTIALVIALSCVCGLAFGQPRVPFTAVLETRIYDSSGAEVGLETTWYAVKSDGSFARRIRLKRAGKEAVEHVEVTDMVLGQHVSSYPSTKLRATMPLDSEDIERLRAKPRAGCDANAGEVGSVLGYKVMKHAVGGFEDYRAPELDCFSLRATLVIRDANGTMWRRERREVLDIVPGEPRAELFSFQPVIQHLPAKEPRITALYPSN
jgi:hypothetical protein